MSNFANDIKKKDKQQERAWERRMKLSDYWYSLSKLCFGGLVLSELVYWHNEDVSIPVLIVGMISTIGSALIATDFLK